MPEHSQSVTLLTMRRQASAVSLAGVSITLVGACLAWTRSGAATRSSFATLKAARTLGVLDSPLSRLAPLWFLLPAVVGLAWLAAGLHRPRWVGALALLVGAAGGAAVVAVVRSPLPAQPGVTVAGLGAGLAVLGGVGALLSRPELGRSPRAAGVPPEEGRTSGPLHKR